jgi:hypothetical protein
VTEVTPIRIMLSRAVIGEDSLRPPELEAR